MPEPRRRAGRAAEMAAALLGASVARAQPVGVPAPTPPAAPVAGAGIVGAPARRAARLGPDAAAAFVPLGPLEGGGASAPLCRAQCAGGFYQCGSGASGGDCATALAVCRRACDADAPPAPGRLQSPLPSAGLAPVGALRPLPGALPPPAR